MITEEPSTEDTRLSAKEIEEVVEQKMQKADKESKAEALGINRAWRRTLLKNVMHGSQSHNERHRVWAEEMTDKKIFELDEKGLDKAIRLMPGNIAMESYQLATFDYSKE